MPEADLIGVFVKPLADSHIRYLISGSVAAMLYGEPRVTHDVDLVVHLNRETLTRLPHLFPPSEFYLPPIEVLTIELAREIHGHFNVIHSGSGLKADCYIVGKDELHAWAFANRREYEVDGVRVSVAPPEYVILRKLEYYLDGGSEKHLKDIRSMLAISEQDINRSVIKEWADRRHLSDLWRTL